MNLQDHPAAASAVARLTAAVTVCVGDGIGPEISSAVLRILEAAGARLAVEHVVIGEKVYLEGISSGISQAAWDSLKRTRLLLKVTLTLL